MLQIRKQASERWQGDEEDADSAAVTAERKRGTYPSGSVVGGDDIMPRLRTSNTPDASLLLLGSAMAGLSAAL